MKAISREWVGDNSSMTKIYKKEKKRTISEGEKVLFYLVGDVLGRHNCF